MLVSGLNLASLYFQVKAKVCLDQENVGGGGGGRKGKLQKEREKCPLLLLKPGHTDCLIKSKVMSNDQKM